MDRPAEVAADRRTGGRIRSAAAHARPEPRTAPVVRRPVAVIVSRFPKITETFILREIQEMERQGQPVRLVPLLRQADPVVHPEAVPWIARALYTPFLSGEIVRDNLRAFRETPGRYLRVLARVLAGSLRSPGLFVGTLGIFPKSVHLGRVLKREGVAHLHGHFATHPAMAAYVASAFSGLPWSFTAHAHDIFLAESRPMLGEKIRRASFVRTISEYNRRFLSERYPEAGDGRTRVIHMGIDPERYGPGEAKPGRILCVASLRPYKGIPSLVEACARPPLRDRDFELVIVGDGPQREEVEARIRELGLESRVRLLGARTQDEVAALLASSSIFVHPSTITRAGWMDGIPVALMEAMATGVPVVSTWVSGIPELIEDGEEGVLVFPDDPGALAEALGRLLDDPEIARAMGARGRRKVEEHFHLERCAASLMDTLQLHLPPVSDELSRALIPGLEAASEGVTSLALRRLFDSSDAVVADVEVHAAAPVASSPPDTRSLVIKAHREVDGAPRSARERARVEFEVLRRIHEGAPGGPRPAVPRPFAHLPDDATVIMERVAGRSLDALLREWKRWPPDDLHALLPALRATGGWLRAFQERTAQEAVLSAADEAVRSPQASLADLLLRTSRDLERTRDRLPSRLESAIGARLLFFAGGGHPTPARVVGHHCDFWPGNVIVDGERATGIDFEGFRPGLPQEDVAYFLTHLELALSWPWLRDARGQAQRAFLEGYGLVEEDDDGLLALCTASTALRLLARSPRRERWSPLGAWRRRAVRGILERALNGPRAGDA